MKVGMIGCGKIAQVRHIPEYLANPDAEIVGYSDFNQERTREVAVKFGGKAYESADALLADPEIDAVSVCVANIAHAEVTIKALNAGKHVLCEKPMATTIEDCEKMVKTAEEKGKYLMIGHNQRLSKAHAKAKELIESGTIGEVLTFRTTFGHGGPEFWTLDKGPNNWFFDKKRASMGAMADLGVHKVDLIQYLIGSRVVEVKAVMKTLDKKDAGGNLISVDDNAICIYTMENGAIGTMSASWTYYGEEDNSTVIWGTKGSMKMYSNLNSYPFYSLEILLRTGERIFFDIDRIQTNDNQTKSGIIDAFVDAVVNDHEPIISGKSVLPAMRAVFASLEASETGKSVRIRQD